MFLTKSKQAEQGNSFDMQLGRVADTYHMRNGAANAA